jgi:hypothetical protein
LCAICLRDCWGYCIHQWEEQGDAHMSLGANCLCNSNSVSMVLTHPHPLYSLHLALHNF